jgi:hypothetical protein
MCWETPALMSEVPAASFIDLLSMEHALSAKRIIHDFAVDATITTAILAQELFLPGLIKCHVDVDKDGQVAIWVGRVHQMDLLEDGASVHLSPAVMYWTMVASS